MLKNICESFCVIISPYRNSVSGLFTKFPHIHSSKLSVNLTLQDTSTTEAFFVCYYFSHCKYCLTAEFTNMAHCSVSIISYKSKARCVFILKGSELAAGILFFHLNSNPVFVMSSSKQVIIIPINYLHTVEYRNSK